MNLNNKISDLMKDLVCMRHDYAVPQNLTVYLANTTTSKQKAKKIGAESANVSSRPENLSERSVPNSPAEYGNQRAKRLSQATPSNLLSSQLNHSTRSGHRTAIASSSQLPPTLQHLSTDTTRSPRTASIYNGNRKRIAAKIDGKPSNLTLTSEEREALISRILTTASEVRSKFDAQARELFSSPKSDNIRRQTPSMKSSFKDKQLLTEASSVASSAELLPSTNPNQRTSSTRRAPKENIKFPTKQSKSKPKPTVGDRTRRTKPRAGRPLTPIPEVSEVDTPHRHDERERHSRSELDKIIAKETLRQKRIESELPSDFITDIDGSLLVQSSDESDSMDELVIKDFAIRVVASEPDAAISSLPIPQQVLIESKKLKDLMESVKERFQVKVARDKLVERKEQKMRIPNRSIRSANVTVPTYRTVDMSDRLTGTQKAQTTNTRSANVTHRTVEGSDRLTDKRKTSNYVNIMDSENWGSAALQKPLFDSGAPSGNNTFNTSSEEDILNESDMLFNDFFGSDNVLEPKSLRTIPYHQPMKTHNTSSERQREQSLDSIRNIEDLESPQFSDHSSDESVKQFPPANLQTSENILDREDPQFPAESSSDEMTINSASEQSKIDSEQHNKSFRDTQNEKDVEKLKELFVSGAIKSLMENKEFEEGVLDLLLRQADSLWDQIVGGIPISFFIPSQCHEKGLLDTSIHEINLPSPLVKKPQRKLPDYMESLENEWTRKTDAYPASAHTNDNSVSDNTGEDLLIKGIPKFSYEQGQKRRYRYRKKKFVNILDHENEPNDSDDSGDVLEDHEMVFDDLTNNTAKPTYDFQKAKLMDDLEKELRFLQILKERKNSSIDKDSPQHQTNKVPVDDTVKLRKSVSFVDSDEGNESTTSARNEPSNISSQNNPLPSTDNESEAVWATLNISKVKELLQQARLAQGRPVAQKGRK